MFNIIKQEIEWGGKSLILETGRVAKQADGAVIVTYGETSVLCTAVMNKNAPEGADYFPLNVHYREMFFASGKIPGGFLKREGRATDKETVVSRLIDRPLRPLFPEGFHNEVQILCSVLSYDGKTNPDVPAVIAASAALAISGIPFEHVIGAVRVGMDKDKFVINPVIDDDDEIQKLDLVVAGTKESILMVEAEAQEIPEEEVIKAIDFAHKSFQPIIKLIETFKKSAGKKALQPELMVFDPDLEKQVKTIADKELTKIFGISDKIEREEKERLLRDEVFDKINPDEKLTNSVSSIFKSLKEKIVRENILKGKRIDGRDLKTVRPITAETSILPRTHGSALFTRGETQALVVTTLGGPQDEQIIDAMDRDDTEHFLLHYNFPPYSVGETGFIRGPGRREIGHGKLAWKAIHPMLPSKEDFPYTIRVVSEITESNGSSSMATVCGTTLALMDAGVPLKAPVAGIAMGLIKKGKDFKILTDILGAEDSLGDMDFKVAGTEKGITALQMDIKIPDVTKEIMGIALNQAKEARISILQNISKVLAMPRKEVSKFAPSIVKLQINKEKIGAVVGPGGKIIKEICATTNTKIDIDDNGMVSITALGKDSADTAVKLISDIAVEPEIGIVYEGIVKQILDFGGVIKFLNKEGLLHISEISHNRVKNVNEALKVGEKIKVKLIEADTFKGKYRLSIKAMIEPPSEDNNSSNNSNKKDDQRNPVKSDSQSTASPKINDTAEEEEEVNYNREGTHYENRNPRQQHFKQKHRNNNNRHNNNRNSWSNNSNEIGSKGKNRNNRRHPPRGEQQMTQNRDSNQTKNKKKYFNI